MMIKVTFWPTGVMETGTLSTQYSQFKKRREKKHESGGWQAPEDTPYAICNNRFGLIRADPYAKAVKSAKVARVKRSDSAPGASIAAIAPILESLETPVKVSKRKIDGGGGSEKKVKIEVM